jgi:kumamolisin
MITDRQCANFLTAAIALLLIGYGVNKCLAQPADNNVKRFDQSIVPLPPQLHPNGPRTAVEELSPNSRNATLSLNFDLATKNLEDLKARVAKGETISPSELAAKYSGDEEKSKKLADWLAQQGFSSIQVNHDHTSVYATATVNQIEKSLGATMKNVTYNGDTTPSATTPPMLPRDVGDAVISINGLQPWIKATKHSFSRKVGVDAKTREESACNYTSYRVKDILRTYNADNLSVLGQDAITGKGQTIAILIDTFPLTADLQKFWQMNNLRVTLQQIQFINTQDPRAQLPPPTGEETLDVEWTSGIAPGATIRVYGTGSLLYKDIDRALDNIIKDAATPGGPRFVSISLGAREDLVGLGQVVSSNTRFLKLSALGVTTFVSSGDEGSNPSGLNQENHQRGPEIRVEYQASDPWIVSVGGTTLNFDTRNSRLIGETAWRDSGGGVSDFVRRPSWQAAYAPISSPFRLVPDVSSVADGCPGGLVILKGEEWRFGGTSWSAPMWVGFAALIAEARQKQGKSRLGFLGPSFYKLPRGVGLRDITSGSNGAYSAGPGWDPVTGLGVPNVRELIQELQ